MYNMSPKFANSCNADMPICLVDIRQDFDQYFGWQFGCCCFIHVSLPHPGQFQGGQQGQLHPGQFQGVPPQHQQQQMRHPPGEPPPQQQQQMRHPGQQQQEQQHHQLPPGVVTVT